MPSGSVSLNFTSSNLVLADAAVRSAKKKKYPDGYPGDAFSTNTSLPVKYSCSKCSKVFPPVPHPDSQEGKDLDASGAEPQICARCGHSRCSECPRAPPRKVEPTFDPDVLKSLEAKLKSLDIKTSAGVGSSRGT